MRAAARIAGLTLGLLMASLAAEAQQSPRVYRVGFLGVTEMSPRAAPLIEALRAGLRDHGYIEGRNLALELRWAEGKLERLPALAAELIGLPVDVLVVGAIQSAVAARAASRTTAVVFITISDPVGAGFVQSLARPGGNLTGLTWDVSPEQLAKGLELVREGVPGASRVAVLWNYTNEAVFRTYAAAMESGARQLKLALHMVSMRRPEELPGALAALERERVDALLVCFSAPLRGEPVLDFAVRHRLPSVGCTRGTAAAGALMSYGSSVPDLYRRAARYVDRILKGARPADLPVEQPTKFELVINARTAKALGLTIPQSLLLRADEVIE